jgi:hypothetical protein
MDDRLTKYYMAVMGKNLLSAKQSGRVEDREFHYTIAFQAYQRAVALMFNKWPSLDSFNMFIQSMATDQAIEQLAGVDYISDLLNLIDNKQ